MTTEKMPCPLSCGNPTSMLKSSFEQLCMDKAGTNTIYLKCSSCSIPEAIGAGREYQQPSEITFINIGEKMAKGSPVGKCVMCGFEKTLKKTRGHMCCSVCNVTISQVNNHEHAIFKMFEVLKGKKLVVASEVEFSGFVAQDEWEEKLLKCAEIRRKHNSVYEECSGLEKEFHKTIEDLAGG